VTEPLALLNNLRSEIWGGDRGAVILLVVVPGLTACYVPAAPRAWTGWWR